MRRSSDEKGGGGRHLAAAVGIAAFHSAGALFGSVEGGLRIRHAIAKIGGSRPRGVNHVANSHMGFGILNEWRGAEPVERRDGQFSAWPMSRAALRKPLSDGFTRRKGAGASRWHLSIVCAALAAGLLLAPDALWAQSANGSRPADKSGFAAEGFPLGGFRVFPVLNAGIDFDDNILFRANTRLSDEIATISPTVSVESQWANHQLIFQGSAIDKKYVQHSDQDNSQYQGSISGRLDVSRTTPITGSISYGHIVEQRGAPGNDLPYDKNVGYDNLSATAGITEQLNRVIVSLNGSGTNYRYKNAAIKGVPVDQSFRDRNTRLVSGRVDYQFSAVTNFYVTGSASKITYLHPVGSFDRGSKIYSVLGGIKFEISRLIHGEIGIGYIDESFSDSSYAPFKGLNYDANIFYSPTPLTSLTFSASRATTDSGLIGVPGLLTSNFQFGVTHELLRTLTLSGSVRMVRLDYRGIDRHQNVLDLALGARKRLNNFLSFGVDLERRRQVSSGLGNIPSVADNRASLTLIASK